MEAVLVLDGALPGTDDATRAGRGSRAILLSTTGEPVAARSVSVAPYLALRGRGLTIKNSALRAGQKAVVEWMYERQKAGDEKAVSCLYWPDSSGEVSTCGLPGGAED